ncbi:hypothetical protein GGR51DRAFT_506549 [Nemania sp. FL0031]|nr:hypothetical protein GGR51DRAFT_506549 [Nemania sp. FL0031]
MWHIRDHILDGLSANQIRPDHYLNEHLRRHRLISDDVYHSVRRYTEVPQPSGICSLDEIPPELQPTDRHYGYEYRNREEERRERRHRHKSGKSRK